MTEKTSSLVGQTPAASEPAPVPAYDPPRVEKLGSLRDHLAAKSDLKGPGAQDTHSTEAKI